MMNLLAVLIAISAQATEVRLGRGENGFHLGDSIEQLNTNAKKLGVKLEREERQPTRKEPGAARYYQAPEGSKISAYTMFIKDGRAESVDLVYGGKPGEKPDFEALLKDLRKRFGKPDRVAETRREEPVYISGTKEISSIEHQRLQNAFWCDGSTIVHLESRSSSWWRELQVKYLDLPPGSSRSFGIVGYSGRSFSCSHHEKSSESSR